jgi:hypothetical protein
VSLFGFLVFVQEMVLLLVLSLLLRGVRDSDAEGVVGHGAQCSPSVTPPSDVTAVDGDEQLDDDMRFLFDVVARQNEGLVQNIDAADNGLIAVAVGIIAITLFTADKWFDLDPNCRFAGFFFLLESAVCIVLGYVTVRFVGAKAENVAQHTDFAIDFAESPAEATSSAISSFTQAAKIQVAVRRLKRTFMMLATFMAVVAAWS